MYALLFHVYLVLTFFIKLTREVGGQGCTSQHKMETAKLKDGLNLLAYFGFFVGCLFFVWGTILDYQSGRTLFQETLEATDDSDNPTLVLCFNDNQDMDISYGKVEYGVLINLSYYYQQDSASAADVMYLKEGNNFYKS